MGYGMYAKSRYNAYGRKRAPTGKAKRWYVDASIPKSVPFIGGSSFRAGSGALTKRSVQAMIHGAMETKYKSCQGVENFNGNASVLQHNTMYTQGITLNIPIGTGKTDRLSSDIHLKTYRARLLINQYPGPISNNLANNFEASHVRIMIIKSQFQASAVNAVDSFQYGLGSTNVFVNGSSELICAIPDMDICVPIYDKTVKLSPPLYTYNYANPALSATAVVHEIDIPLNHTHSFLTGTGTTNYSKEYNYYLVVIPYIYNGTNGSTNVCGLIMESLLTYNDAR